MAKYTGQIILTVNGLPVLHVKSLDYRISTNRELVVGMSPTGMPLGHTGGSKEYSLTLEVYLPASGELVDWENLTEGVILATPRDGGAMAPIWTGCFTTEVGAQFSEKGAAVRRIEMMATGRVGML